MALQRLRPPHPLAAVDVIPPGDAWLARHCYAATCDGGDCNFCGDLLMGRDNDDDTCAVHAATPSDLADFALDSGWRITTDLSWVMRAGPEGSPIGEGYEPPPVVKSAACVPRATDAWWPVLHFHDPG